MLIKPGTKRRRTQVEIEDEHDEVVAFVERTPHGTIRLNTRLTLRDAARELGFEMPETTVHSLGGFLVERLGRIPRRGDQIEYDDLEFTVLEATRRRLLRVEVRPTGDRVLPPESSTLDTAREMRTVPESRDPQESTPEKSEAP